MRMLAGRVGGDPGLDAAQGEFIAQVFGVVGPVGQQGTRTADWAAAGLADVELS